MTGALRRHLPLLSISPAIIARLIAAGSGLGSARGLFAAAVMASPAFAALANSDARSSGGAAPAMASLAAVAGLAAAAAVASMMGVTLARRRCDR